MALENIRQDMALSAAHIDQRSESPARKSGRNFGAFGSINSGHKPAHELTAFRVGGDVLKERHPVGGSEGRLAGFEYCRKLLPSLENCVVIEDEDHLPKRGRRAVAHKSGNVGVRELAVGGFIEDPEGCQRAQQAAQRGGRKAGVGGEGFGGLGSVGEEIGDAALGGDAKSKRHARSDHQFSEASIRRSNIAGHGLLSSLLRQRLGVGRDPLRASAQRNKSART